MKSRKHKILIIILLLIIMIYFSPLIAFKANYNLTASIKNPSRGSDIVDNGHYFQYGINVGFNKINIEGEGGVTQVESKILNLGLYSTIEKDIHTYRLSNKDTIITILTFKSHIWGLGNSAYKENITNDLINKKIIEMNQAFNLN